jgi:RNase P/RNase MRP subunit POP5
VSAALVSSSIAAERERVDAAIVAVRKTRELTGEALETTGEGVSGSMRERRDQIASLKLEVAKLTSALAEVRVAQAVTCSWPG